ncbi:MAG: hypothetical protein Q9P01_06500 [Anaerolineae bacterium]|nr:hypothetical protein [Anaerolineae bacterium]
MPKSYPDAWGALIISENQDGLRRVDLVIFWNGVQIENGIVQIDDDGEIVPRLIHLTEVTDGDKTELVEVELAEDGSFMLNGEAVAADNVLTVREQRMHVEHIFIHEDSAYFD